MIPFSSWRDAFRIPWLRENRSGFRFLHEVFQLMVVLYRSGRLRDFAWAERCFFEMAHSIAQYGKSEAGDTVSRLLEIPWFRQRRRHLLGMISAYNRVVAALGLNGRASVATAKQVENARPEFEAFVRSLKGLLEFDERDEERVRDLMADSEEVDRRISEILHATTTVA